MTPSEVFFLTVLAKLICELAVLLLLARAILALWLRSLAAGNPVYRLLVLLTRPTVALGRWLSPRLVLPQHHAWVAFMVRGWCWLGLVALKVHWCRQGGLACAG
jgi:hypothetical protein